MIYQKYKMPKLTSTLIIIMCLSTSLWFFAQKQTCAEEQNDREKSWKELTSYPQYSINQSFLLYRLKTSNGSRAALIVVDLNDHSFTLKPFFSKQTETVSKMVKEQRALAGINGGFFNLSDGKSTSYIVIDGKNQCDPKTNKALISNPTLTPYLETIYNRSEFRIISNKEGKLKADITSHLDPIPDGWTLQCSLQAGPKLLPAVTDEEEAFVRKSGDNELFDAIGSRKKSARTAIGITRDNHILLLAVADKKQDSFSSGVTLEELGKLMHTLGCNQALNCDGGTSTTLVIAQGDSRDQFNYLIHKEIATDSEKLVKSGFLVERTLSHSNSRSKGNSFPH